jgi:hypothetical protein
MVPGPLHVITSDPGDDACEFLQMRWLHLLFSSKIRIAHRELEDCHTFIRLGIDSF